MATPIVDPVSIQRIYELVQGGDLTWDLIVDKINEENSKKITGEQLNALFQHNNLAGKQAGQTGEYNHLTNAELSFLQVGIPMSERYHILDEVLVASGETDKILPVEIYVPTGYKIVTSFIIAKIESGTNVVLNLKKNGSVVTTLGTAGDMTVTTTRTVFTPSSELLLNNGDEIVPFVKSVSGTPINLNIQIINIATPI